MSKTITTAYKPRHHIVFDGSIVPLTPISVSKIGADKDCPQVPIINVVTPGGVVSMPQIGGETFKGFLRATSAEEIFETKGLPRTTEAYLILAKGGIKSDEKETTNIMEHLAFREKNPMAGLYGNSAPVWSASAMSVLPAMPIDATSASIASTGGRARRDDFRQNPSLLARFSEDEVEGYLQRLNDVKENSAKKVETSKIDAELKKLKAKREDNEERIAELQALKQKEAERKGPIAVGRPLDPVYGIAPGSILHSKIILQGVTDVEAGLFLRTLERMQWNCRIGGYKAIGHGFFQANWKISIRDGSVLRQIGSVSVAPYEFSISSDKTIDGLLAAYDNHDFQDCLNVA